MDNISSEVDLLNYSWAGSYTLLQHVYDSVNIYLDDLNALGPEHLNVTLIMNTKLLRQDWSNRGMFALIHHL